MAIHSMISDPGSAIVKPSYIELNAAPANGTLSRVCVFPFEPLPAQLGKFAGGCAKVVTTGAQFDALKAQATQNLDVQVEVIGAIVQRFDFSPR